MDRLAQPHVVGQTGAQTQFGHEPEPAHSGGLIRAQRRLQIAPRLEGLDRFRLAQVLERLAEPIAGRDPRPGGGLFIDGVAGVEPGACEHPHSFDETDPIGMLLLEQLPMVEGLLELLAIDLDPFAAEQHQPLARGQQLAAFGFGQRFAVEAHRHVEIQQAIQTGRARRRRADPHLHLRSRRLAGRPPIGHPHHHSRFFDPR